MQYSLNKPKTRIDITDVYKDKEKLLKKRIRTDDEDYQIGFYSDQIREGTSFLIHMIPEEFSDELADKLADMITKKKITSSDQMKIIVDKYKEGEPTIKKPEKKLTLKQKQTLKESIPDNYYSERNLELIGKEIDNDSIRELSDIPTLRKSKNAVPNPFKPVIVVKKTKGGVRPGAGRKADVVKEIKEVPLSVIPKKRGRKPKSTEGEKAKAMAKKLADKEAKRLANLKPYFKADEPPKGYRKATVLEAVKEKKVLLYGKKKVDSKLIDSMFETGTPIKKQILDIQLKIVSKIGLLTRLKKELEAVKGDERVDSTAKEDRFTEIRKEVIELNEKKKKLEAKMES
jgi:hypothetical protein